MRPSRKIWWRRHASFNRIAHMPIAMSRFLRPAVLTTLLVGWAMPAHADAPTLSLGALYGYGGGVDVYGVQAIWTPRPQARMLEDNGLEFRIAGQVARWLARDQNTGHDSLTNGNVLTELRYSPLRHAAVRPFAELGFGIDLISHVKIGKHNLATAFNFGSQGALGVTFGDNGRFEIAAVIHHASNARIKQPNQGLTYSGIRIRVGLD